MEQSYNRSYRKSFSLLTRPTEGAIQERRRLVMWYSNRAQNVSGERGKEVHSALKQILQGSSSWWVYTANMSSVRFWRV